MNAVPFRPETWQHAINYLCYYSMVSAAGFHSELKGASLTYVQQAAAGSELATADERAIFLASR